MSIDKDQIQTLIKISLVYVTDWFERKQVDCVTFLLRLAFFRRRIQKTFCDDKSLNTSHFFISSTVLSVNIMAGDRSTGDVRHYNVLAKLILKNYSILTVYSFLKVLYIIR